MCIFGGIFLGWNFGGHAIFDILEHQTFKNTACSISTSGKEQRVLNIQNIFSKKLPYISKYIFKSLLLLLLEFKETV